MYKIVAEYTLENLALEISKLINDRYVPVGNLVLEPHSDGSTRRYIQPMCKIEVTLQ